MSRFSIGADAGGPELILYAIIASATAAESGAITTSAATRQRGEDASNNTDHRRTLRKDELRRYCGRIAKK